MATSSTIDPSYQRRDFLSVAGSAFLGIPLAAMASEGIPEKQARVKRVVFFFMNGGPSQIDTFDPKPALKKLNGKSYVGESRVGSAGRIVGKLWESEFKFRNHGQSGLEISELFPEVAQHADDLCVIRSLQSPSALHAPAILEMNTGRIQTGGASLGSWVDFGLGDLDSNLPSFAVMLDPRGGPISGNANWSNGQLPVSPASLLYSVDKPFLNLRKQTPTSAEDELRMRELLRNLNQHASSQRGEANEISNRMRAYELAWKMQASASESVDLSQETMSTQQRYGIHQKPTGSFGTQCLLARRLLERGVRFVQIYSGGGEQKNTWDSHVDNVNRHRKFAGETDRPIAAFLTDLKETGLWDETLVIWGGEFGRTPTREDTSNGRDHNPHGFTMWLAGGGVRGGHVVGATDEIGLNAVENVAQVADLHATILHLLGIDHESLGIYSNGLEVRLTGPEPCRIIQEVLS